MASSLESLPWEKSIQLFSAIVTLSAHLDVVTVLGRPVCVYLIAGNAGDGFEPR